MTDATATGRSTAAALLLLFALVVAILAALIVPAFIGWTENGRSIREDRARIDTVKASQTAFIRVKNANDRWTLFARSPEAGFLDAATAEEALVVARERIETVLADHGGDFDTGTIRTGEVRRAQVETVDMELTVILPKASLIPFLADLEDTRPYAFISAFALRESGPDAVRLTLTGQMQRLMEPVL